MPGGLGLSHERVAEQPAPWPEAFQPLLDFLAKFERPDLAQNDIVDAPAGVARLSARAPSLRDNRLNTVDAPFFEPMVLDRSRIRTCRAAATTSRVEGQLVVQPRSSRPCSVLESQEAPAFFQALGDAARA